MAVLSHNGYGPPFQWQHSLPASQVDIQVVSAYHSYQFCGEEALVSFHYELQEISKYWLELGRSRFLSRLAERVEGAEVHRMFPSGQVGTALSGVSL